jgi:hypothetical protein
MGTKQNRTNKLLTGFNKHIIYKHQILASLTHSASKLRKRNMRFEALKKSKNQIQLQNYYYYYYYYIFKIISTLIDYLLPTNALDANFI